MSEIQNSQKVHIIPLFDSFPGVRLGRHDGRVELQRLLEAARFRRATVRPAGAHRRGGADAEPENVAGRHAGPGRGRHVRRDVQAVLPRRHEAVYAKRGHAHDWGELFADVRVRV